MNLNEKNEILVSRGMPRHPNVYAGDPKLASSAGGWWLYKMPGSHTRNEITIQSAEDMLGQHALRWLMSGMDLWAKEDERHRYLELRPTLGSDGKLQVALLITDYDQGKDNENLYFETLLDAVLEATKNYVKPEEIT